MSTRALVLGGGGVVGIAWETGLLAGLQEGGVDPAAAGVLIGTSAGSVVSTQIASGASLAELYRQQTTEIDATVAGAPHDFDVAKLTAIFAKWSAASEMTQDVRAEIGRMALEAPTVSEEERFRITSGRLVGGDAWPEKRLLITAVDAQDGAFVVWDRDSGASLARAVASSCAVPGMFPPVTIKGRRYVDGGVRSGTSADLAIGSDAVIVVAVMTASMAGIGGVAARQLEAEVAELRAAGSTVEVIKPDAASQTAFGPNLMDPAHRTAAAEAGHAQGLALAPSLRGLWGGT